MARCTLPILLALALTGCPRADAPPDLAPPAARSGAQPIRLAGDGTATPLVNHLVQVFESRLPGRPIVVEPPLGVDGARAAMADGLLSGVLATVVAGRDGSGALLARSPVVLVVGPGVRARRVTPEALAALAGGTADDWPGGLPRQLVLRPIDDPLQAALAAATPGLGGALTEAVRARRWPVHSRETTLREALRRPGVLGVADRGNLRLHGSPTWEVDLPGRQPAAVEIRLEPAEPVPARLRAFLAFATGEEGRGLVVDLGFEAPGEAR